MSGDECDVIVVHWNSGSPPVDSGGRVSHVREADAFRRGQICAENTPLSQARCPQPADKQRLRKDKYTRGDTHRRTRPGGRESEAEDKDRPRGCWTNSPS